MTPEAADAIIKEFIGVLRKDLEEAAGLALAAEASAERDVIGKAVEIANEIDDHTHDAGVMLAAIALIRRRFIPRNSDAEGES